MIVKSYVKCSVCNRVQYQEIYLKTTDVFTKDTPRELEWKCNECGMLNFIEVKVKEVD